MASNLSSSVPFPPIPGSLFPEFGIDALRLRAYGTEAADLDVDFRDPDLPRLAVAILTACTRAEPEMPIAPDLFAHIEVGKRTEALLALAALSGKPLIDIHLRCANSACREPMEVELSMDELRELQRAAEQGGRPAAAIGGERILFRRPTGKDQAAWRRHRYPDEESAVRAVAETLVVEEFRLEFRRLAARDPAWADAVDRAMQEGDPLVDFRMRVICPVCGEQASYTVDLIDHVIERLRGIQQNLAGVVHRLASRYHWSEAEIFAVAPWRRERYLALIDREERR
jgi:hypothetical protein